jgi:tight adherence protein C
MTFSPELLKLTALLATFAMMGLISYTLLRRRSLRVSIRSGIEDAYLDNPAVTDTRAATMRGSFSNRVVGGWLSGLVKLVYRFGPQGLAEHTRKRLTVAGLAERMDADGFYALSIGAGIGAFAFVLTLSSIGNFPPLGWIIIPLAAFLPKMWLTSKVEARQRDVRLGLPDTLDLLTIAVEAGLGFDAALSRVVANIPGALSDELYRMLQELKIGIPRNRALRGLSERTDVPELDQFITAVTQAETFGISVGRVLRVQAEQLRLKRTQMAEERAAKTPVKLLFPLILCIFPALFVVLVGPAAIQVIENVFGRLG